MRVPISDYIKKLSSSILNSFRIEQEEEAPGALDGIPEEVLNTFLPSSPEEGSQEYSTNTNTVTNDPDSHKEKGYKAAPKIKPKRRSTRNKSETRGYRNEYQKEYRREHGNGYIKKPKKNPEN